jgi:hypothetical protein
MLLNPRKMFSFSNDGVGVDEMMKTLGLVHTFQFSTGRELTGWARAQLGTA